MCKGKPGRNGLQFLAAGLIFGFAGIAAVLPASVWAWGNEGHRITGLVASELLTPKARIRMNQIIPNTNLGEFANQMDFFRPTLSVEIPGSDKWHYDNQPICGTKTFDQYCPNGVCASGKIPVYFKILGDANTTPEARAQAAMFLVHMVGDIHQPLHAADDNDQGGNQKNIQLPRSDFPRRLHGIWDSDLVKIALRGISEADYAQQLVSRFKDKEIPGWQSGDVRDWMTESHTLSQKVTYGNLPEFTCGVPWPIDKMVSLPQGYVDRATDIIPMQLAKAGARIAWLLNRALDTEAAPGFAIPTNATPVTKRIMIESWLPESEIKVETSTDMSIKDYCVDIKARFAGKMDVQCGIVGFPGGETFIVLDKMSDASMKPAREAGNTKCISDFNNRQKELWNKYFALIVIPGEKRDTAEAALKEFAVAQQSNLLSYLGSDYCDDTRRAAADLLKYTNDCLTSAATVVPLLADADYAVRNGIGQCVMQTQKQSTDIRKAIVDASIAQLALPNHSDRNKAIATIRNATLADLEVKAYVRDKYTAQIKRIADRSILPNVGGLAKRLLEELAAPAPVRPASRPAPATVD